MCLRKRKKKRKKVCDGLLDGHIALGMQLVMSFAFVSQVAFKRRSADIKFNTLNYTTCLLRYPVPTRKLSVITLYVYVSFK